MFAVINCMKVKFLKLKNWLLVTVMGALGLSSCHCHKQMAEPEEDPAPTVRDRGEVRLMYGVPTMNYSIQGRVRDAEGNPVKDIRVNMLERNMETTPEGELVGDPENVSRYLKSTEVVTDRGGHFEIKNSGLPQTEVKLLIRDVDGQENGSYQNQVLSVPVLPEDLDRQEAGGWNQGTFNKDLDVRVEKK